MLFEQGVKAIAIARSFLADDSVELSCFPEFRADRREGLKLVLTKQPARAIASTAEVLEVFAWLSSRSA